MCDLETQKEGKKSTPKGEVTSTVRERSREQCKTALSCMPAKDKFSKPRTRVSTAFFVFLSVDANSIE